MYGILEVLLHYQVSFVPLAKRNTAHMARGASTRNPQSSLLVSCKLPEISKTIGVHLSAKCTECVYVSPVNTTVSNKNDTKTNKICTCLFCPAVTTYSIHNHRITVSGDLNIYIGFRLYLLE